MAGLFNGNWDQPGSGILPSGDAGMTYPPYTQVPAPNAPASAYAPQPYISRPPVAPSPMQNYSPAAPQMTAQPAGGFMDRLSGALNSPLTQFGLGLASGRTPQEGIGNALQSQQFRQKLEHEKMTTAMKEYQYAISTGGLPPGTTFPEFLQVTSGNQAKLSMQGIPLVDEEGNVAYGQVGNKPGSPMQLTKPPPGYQVANKLLKGASDTHTWLYDPNTGQIAPGTYQSKNVAEGAQEKRTGTETAIAMQRLPAIETTTARALTRLDALENHPGLDTATGFIMGKSPIAPTPAARDAIARIQEIQGEAWTQGIESMRGLGALSDAEGKRIEQARSRLSARDVSTEDYKKAIRDLKEIMQTGRENARKIASGQMKPYSTGESKGDDSGWTDLGGGMRIRQK